MIASVHLCVRLSVCLSVCLSVRLSVMLSPPKPLDENQPNLVCELLICMGRGEGSKGQISFSFNYKVNLKDFYTKLCVCSHKWKIRNISDGIFILSPGPCTRGGTLGRWGAQGSKKNSNIVMWNIKSTGMKNRKEFKLNFHPRVKLVTLGWGQKVKYQ